MLVEVVRNAGDRPAESDVVDELCQTLEVCTERGRNFLDEQGFDKTQLDIEIPHRRWVGPGRLVLVNDSSLGELFKSKVLSCKISVQVQERVVSASQTLTLERSHTNG